MDASPPPAPSDDAEASEANAASDERSRGRFLTPDRLREMVREALSVLAAILVAFALDAWWDELRERRTMLDALDAVAVELDRNVAELDSTVVRNERQAALVYEFLELGPGEVGVAAPEDLARFAALPNFDVAALELGAATAFIEGGYLALMDDREARAAVASIPRLQVELDEEAEVVLDASSRLSPALLQLMPVDAYLARDLANPESSRPFLTALAASEPTRSLLFERTFFLQVLYGAELEGVRDRLAEIRAQIAARPD